MSPPTRSVSASTTRARCQHPRCSYWVAKGQTHCARHRDERDDAGTAPTVVSPTPPPGITPYRVLLDNHLRETLAEATSEILDKGLIDELGALRVVLLRVLVEETETPTLVANITRIVTVAAQAMRVQHAVSGDQATSVTEAIGNIITQLVPEPSSTPAPTDQEERS